MILLTKGEISWENDIVTNGRGLFETIYFHHKWFELEEHLWRMKNSALELGIGKQHWQEIPDIFANLSLPGNCRLAIRLTLAENGYALIGRPVPYHREQYRQGVKVGIYPFERGRNPLYTHKTTSYFQYSWAKEYADGHHWDEAIFVDCQGNILEGSRSNIFVKMNDTYCFPINRQNFLDGIMQQKMVQYFQKKNIPYDYRDIHTSQLNQIQAVYLTNSLMRLMPVAAIGSHTYPTEEELVDVFLKEAGI